MEREAKTYLYDMLQAARLLDQFSADKRFEDYERNALLRSAVERQFEVIGEALSQLHKSHPAVAEGITDYRQIIAFRNILIHGYAVVDDRVVWDLLKNRLPGLRAQLEALLIG